MDWCKFWVKKTSWSYLETVFHQFSRILVNRLTNLRKMLYMLSTVRFLMFNQAWSSYSLSGYLWYGISFKVKNTLVENEPVVNSWGWNTSSSDSTSISGDLPSLLFAGLPDCRIIIWRKFRGGLFFRRVIRIFRKRMGFNSINSWQSLISNECFQRIWNHMRCRWWIRR